MPSKNTTSTIGAGVGGAAGSYFGPAGTAIGAGLGGAIGGMFGSSEGPPKFSEIQLKRDNPELWKELQELKAATREYQRLYDQRRKGATPGEVIEREESRSQLAGQLSNRGMIGSSAGASLMAGNDAKIQAAIAERAFAEQQRLLEGLKNAQAQYSQMYQGAQQGIMGQNMAEFQQAQAEDAARNQFYSGLFNSGLNLYAGQRLGDLNSGNGGGGFNPYGPAPSVQAGQQFTMPTVGASYGQAPAYGVGGYYPANYSGGYPVYMGTP